MQNTIAKQLTAALTQHMTGAMTTLATQICEDYNKTVARLNDEIADLNHELECDKEQYDSLKADYDEAQQRIAEAEKRIAELTSALATAGKAEPTPQPQPKSEKPKRTKKYGKDSIRHKMYDLIMNYIKRGKNVFLGGPAGSGKSQIAEMIAEDLDLPFYVSSQVTQEYKIEGFQNAQGEFMATDFYKAFVYGGIFVLEEMDASSPDVIVLMNTALANGYVSFPGVGMVYKHKDFHCIATGNTCGTGADAQYTGRQQLDASTLDRFKFVNIGYDERIELVCAKQDRELVQFVHDIRNAIEQSGACINFPISYRGITEVKEDILAGIDINQAMQSNIVKGMDADNISLLYNNLTMRSNKYAQAFKACATSAGRMAA